MGNPNPKYCGERWSYIRINILKPVNIPGAPDAYQNEYKEAFFILCES